MYGNGFGNYDYYTGNSMSNGNSTWVLISVVVAVVAGICLYFTVFSKENAKKYKGFMAKLYDFIQFKKLYITDIIKISYLVLAIFMTLVSFAVISTSFLAFLLMLVLGNLILRIVYEFSIVILSIHENTSEINKKLK